MNQAKLKEASELHKEVEQLEQHCSLIDNELDELIVFYENIKKIGNPSGKEILASLGKGVFSYAKMEGNELFVDVGAGIIVKKPIDEVKEVVEIRIENLGKTKMLFNQQLEMKFSMLQNIIEEIEK